MELGSPKQFGDRIRIFQQIDFIYFKGTKVLFVFFRHINQHNHIQGLQKTEHGYSVDDCIVL